MHKTKHQKVGNSVMASIPAELLNILRLAEGDTVGISIVSNRLIVESQPRLRYTLAELLAASDYSIPQQREEIYRLKDCLHPGCPYRTSSNHIG